MDTVLRHPGDAKVTTTRPGDGARTEYEVWISDGEIVRTYSSAHRLGTQRPIRNRPRGLDDRDFPGTAKVYEPVTALPAETLPETFVHPAGYCQNVLATGRCMVTGTEVVIGREAILLECDHPRTTELSGDRPDFHISIAVDRDTGVILRLVETIGGAITRARRGRRAVARRPPATGRVQLRLPHRDDDALLIARRHCPGRRMSDQDDTTSTIGSCRARGDGPRRPDRHDRGRHHGHAGPPDGQARPGPGVPRRGHLPRRPLLYLPAGHGHGDEHARGVQADELGDRLRRLDRRAGLGPAPRAALAARDGDGPRRRGRRGDRARDPGRPADHPQAPGRARGEGRLRAQGRLGIRVLRAQGFMGGAGRAGLAGPPPVRPLQRGLPPPAGHQGRAAPSTAAQPDDGGGRADRVQQGRGRQRPARGQHPLRPRARPPPTGASSSSTAPRRSPTSTAGGSPSWPSPTITGRAHPVTST